jgi:hypothetical protein
MYTKVYYIAAAAVRFIERCRGQTSSIITHKKTERKLLPQERRARRVLLGRSFGKS